MTFDAGSIQAKLELDRTPFQRSLREAKAEADKLSGKDVKVKVTADTAEAGAKMDNTGRKADDLGRKRETIRIKADTSDADRKMSEIGKKIDALTKPSLIGAGIALSPALIPLTAGVAAGLTGVAASFGAAAIGAGAFAKVATSVLSGASQDAAKLQAAQMRLNAANTAAAKKSAQQALATLTAGWSKGYKQLIFDLRDFQTQWKATSQAIAVPVIRTWLKTIEDGLKFLKPLLDPVAREFRTWGQDLDRYFNSHAGSDEITRLARSFGQLSASQLGDAVKAIGEIGKGVAQLGRDAGVSGGSIAGIGGDLDRWATAFDDWAHSARARQDVQAFLAYLHRNGPLVTGVLKSLAKDLGGFVKGASGLGSLELRAVDDFLTLLSKMPQSVAKPLIDAAGALLLLSKTGVLRVGIKVVGAAANLLSGGSLTVGGGTAAAEIRTAMVSGGTAAAAEIRAAMAGGGAVATGEESAAGGAAGGLFSKIGGGAAGAKVAGAGLGVSFAGAVLAAALLYFTTHAHVGQKTIWQLGDPPGPGQKATWMNSWSVFGKDIGHALVLGAVPAGAGFIPALASKVKDGLSHITGQVATASRGWGKAIDPGIFDPFTRAANQASQAIKGDFTKQQQAAHAARSALNEYSTAIRQNGVNSSEARSARASLLRDLENAGVDSRKARTDVANYTSAVKDNGLKSSQAQSARRALVRDILNASGNAKQGRTDLRNYTNAVQDNGAKSSAARSARQALIKDLENAGLSAKDARALVNQFSAAIRRIPKPQTVTIHAHGEGKTTFKVGTTGLVGTAEGWYVSGGVPGKDSVPIMAMPGELVVPRNLVAGGAVDHLRGMIPGFETGGVVGSQAGKPPATASWYIGQEQAADAMLAGFIGADVAKLIDQAKAKAATSGALGGNAAANAALARKLMPAWATGSAWSAWNSLEMREAGWNRFAENPSSGAYGIPQALPPTKMPKAAQKSGGSHAGPQIDWMVSYIKGRYGTPQAAWAHEQSAGWYAKGGLIPGYAKGGLIARGRELMHHPHKGKPYNDQIARVTTQYHQDLLLSKAKGLKAGTRVHYKNLATHLGAQLKTLQHEADALRAWRGSLQSDDAGYSATRAAAKAHHLTGEYKRLSEHLKANAKRIKAVDLRLNGPPPKKKAGSGSGGGGSGGSDTSSGDTSGTDTSGTTTPVAPDFSAFAAAFPVVAPDSVVTYSGLIPASGSYDSGGWLKPGVTLSAASAAAAAPAAAPSPVMGGGQSDQVIALLQRLAYHAERNPALVGAALAQGINGVARGAGQRALFQPMTRGF